MLVVIIQLVRKLLIWYLIVFVNWPINVLVFKDFSSSIASEVKYLIKKKSFIQIFCLFFIRWYWFRFYIIINGTSQC